jgi:hypothetical protein
MSLYDIRRALDLPGKVGVGVDNALTGWTEAWKNDTLLLILCSKYLRAFLRLSVVCVVRAENK